MTKLTDVDRKRVQDVLDLLLDDMSDSYDTSQMFAPFGALVEMILDSEEITVELLEIQLISKSAQREERKEN